MSTHETDKVIENVPNEPKRNVIEMIACLCCGDTFEGNDETPCPRCSKNAGKPISNNIYRTRFNKFAVSD